MSAFVVSKNHLDLLVTAGLRLEAWYGPLRWFDREPTDAEREELFVAGSALSLRWAAWEDEHRRTLTAKSAGRVGAMLWAENVCSVNHRYGEQQWEEPYTFEALHCDAVAVDPLDVFEAISRYEYQACEHPGWATSEARLFCAALTKRGIETLLDRRGTRCDVNDRALWTSDTR